jgi:hypothetical protein
MSGSGKETFDVPKMTSLDLWDGIIPSLQIPSDLSLKASVIDVVYRKVWKKGGFT